MLILLPAMVIAVVWVLFTPGERFLPRLARLLEDPTIHRGTFSPLSGRSDAFGRFGGRDVAIHVQLKRSRYGLGFLLIAVRTSASIAVDHNGIAARLRDAAAQEALSTIVSQDLLLDLADGWLRVLWKPHGFIIFPGRFVEARWRAVLEAMHLLAAALEAPAAR